MSVYILIVRRDMSVTEHTGLQLIFSVSIIAVAMFFFSVLTYIGDTPAKYLKPAIKQMAPLISFANTLLYSSITVALIISAFKKNDRRSN